MTDPKSVIHRILDADDLSGGRTFVQLWVRENLKDLFESARIDSGTEAEGMLFQSAYCYVPDQKAEVVMRLVPFESLGSSNHEIYEDVEVRITDPE